MADEIVARFFYSELSGSTIWLADKVITVLTNGNQVRLAEASRGLNVMRILRATYFTLK